MSGFKTPQEQFWAGDFGDAYLERNKDVSVAHNIALFAKILARAEAITSIIEFGANIGLNLIALRQLLPQTEMSAIEINNRAVAQLKLINELKVYHQSILDYSPDYQRDLVVTKGVLIHINPEYLPQVYDTLYRASKRYICLAEYYNPTPIAVPYQSHQEMLYKRDFAGEMLDRFPVLRLVDYGFAYHRDPVFPQGDLTWFLMENAG